MIAQLLNVLAQAETGPVQKEYYQAYSLVAAMVLLGLLVICIPRPRAKHFVDPDDVDKKDAKNKKKKR